MRPTYKGGAHLAFLVAGDVAPVVTVAGYGIPVHIFDGGERLINGLLIRPHQDSG